MHVAASLRAGSNESSRSDANDSDSGLICGGGTGDVDVARQRPRNFKVPSFTCGFLDPSAGKVSGRMSANVVYNGIVRGVYSRSRIRTYRRKYST